MNYRCLGLVFGSCPEVQLECVPIRHDEGNWKTLQRTMLDRKAAHSIFLWVYVSSFLLGIHNDKMKYQLVVGELD